MLLFLFDVFVFLLSFASLQQTYASPLLLSADNEASSLVRASVAAPSSSVSPEPNHGGEKSTIPSLNPRHSDPNILLPRVITPPSAESDPSQPSQPNASPSAASASAKPDASPRSLIIPCRVIDGALYTYIHIGASTGTDPLPFSLLVDTAIRYSWINTKRGPHDAGALGPASPGRHQLDIWHGQGIDRSFYQADRPSKTWIVDGGSLGTNGDVEAFTALVNDVVFPKAAVVRNFAVGFAIKNQLAGHARLSPHIDGVLAMGPRAGGTVSSRRPTIDEHPALVERLVQNTDWKGFTIDWQTTHAATLGVGQPLIAQTDKLAIAPHTGLPYYQRFRADPDAWAVAKEENPQIYEVRDGVPNLIDNAAFGGPPRVLLATGAKGILVGHKLASWYYHNAYNPGEWQEMNREIFVKCSVKPKIRFMIVLASANIPIATRRARQYMVDSETTGWCKGSFIPTLDPAQATLITLGQPFFRDYVVGFHFGERADRSDRYIEFAPPKDVVERQKDFSVEVASSYAAACRAAAAASGQNQYSGFDAGPSSGGKRKWPG